MEGPGRRPKRRAVGGPVKADRRIQIDLAIGHHVSQLGCIYNHNRLVAVCLGGQYFCRERVLHQKDVTGLQGPNLRGSILEYSAVPVAADSQKRCIYRRLVNHLHVGLVGDVRKTLAGAH